MTLERKVLFKIFSTNRIDRQYNNFSLVIQEYQMIKLLEIFDFDWQHGVNTQHSGIIHHVCGQMVLIAKVFENLNLLCEKDLKLKRFCSL